MPPTPPESKNASVGKEKANPGLDDRRTTMTEEEEENLVKEFLASTTETGRSLRPAVEKMIDEEARAPPPTPDNPPCDGCKEPYAGTMLCGRCQSVFYCGRECQVSHWSSTHRGECKRLKERNRETAKRVVNDFENLRNWKALDVAGAYKAAVKLGLHDKIRDVLGLDNREMIVTRYMNTRDAFSSYTFCTMSVLFRGRRDEGNVDAKSRSVDCVDGLRIKGYVRSHPGALDAWLQASARWIQVITDRILGMGLPQFYYQAISVASEIWSMWSLAFVNSEASRAILSPFPSDGDEGESSEQRRKRGEDHARGIVQTLAEALRLLGGVPNPRVGRNPVFAVEVAVIEVAALVLLRTQEYGIDIDVEGILNLEEGERKNNYFSSVLFAKRMIEKGRTLSAVEKAAVIDAAVRELGLDGKCSKGS